MTDYEKEIEKLVKIYGEEWLREVGRLIAEGDRERNDLSIS